MTVRSLLTAEEFARLDVGENRAELVRGELVMMTPAGARHGLVAGRLGGILSAFVAERGLGEVLAAETGYILGRNPDTVRAPDVSFVARNRAAEGFPDGFAPFAPDLAVEVLSPGDTFAGVLAKVQDYLAAGTRAVWLVDPMTRTVTVYLSGGSVRFYREEEPLDGGDVLPGLRIDLRKVFA